MESQPSQISFRRKVGYAAVTVMILHILICLSAVLIPKQYGSNSRFLKTYRQLFVLGPFFSEDRIASSHYLTVRYQKNGLWSAPRNLVTENLQTFHQAPFRLDRLPYNDYEKRLSYSVAKMAYNRPFSKVAHARLFRELNAFIMNEYPEASVDSVHIVYGSNRYNPGNKKYQLDTVFQYTYHPANIGKAEN